MGNNLEGVNIWEIKMVSNKCFIDNNKMETQAEFFNVSFNNWKLDWLGSCVSWDKPGPTAMHRCFD